ncbi:unnamed protein product [Brachionus calyciflorus]|uniref:Uncharacterized protein n=1 Tax=Brachionus calyciflorus TaxID=104777 RepID=A0A814KB53_9BILA|nr:unnamed protein product [Brachionus calyciflorus]
MAHRVNDFELTALLKKQETFSKSRSQKLRKQIAYLHSTQQALRLRINKDEQTCLLSLLTDFNKLLLDHTTSSILRYTSLYLAHSKPGSGPPDSNHKHTNYKEWSNINKWLKSNPLTNPTHCFTNSPLASFTRPLIMDSTLKQTLITLVHKINSKDLGSTTPAALAPTYADSAQPQNQSTIQYRSQPFRQRNQDRLQGPNRKQVRAARGHTQPSSGHQQDNRLLQEQTRQSGPKTGRQRQRHRHHGQTLLHYQHQELHRLES